MSESGGSTGFRLFAQRISITWLTSILMAATTIIVLPIITKNLTQSDYGSWVLITTTLGIASILATLSLNTAIYRFFPGASDVGKREIIWSIITAVFILSLLCSGGILIMYLTGIGHSFLPGREVAILVMIAIPLYCLATILPAYFIAMKKIKLYSLILLVQSYGELILYIYFIRYGITGLIVSILLVRVAMLILIMYFIIRDTGFSPPKLHVFRDLFRFNFPLLTTKLSSWVVESSDRYIIDFFLTEKAVAAYSPGYSLGTMSYMIVSPLESMLTVTVSEQFERGNIDDVRKYLEYSLKYIFMFMIPAFFGLSILATQILVYLTKQEYATISAQFTVFTALSMLLLSICVVMNPVLMLYKKTGVIGIAWGLAAVANFALNLVAVPMLGIIGAAITTLVAYAVIFAYVTMNAYRLLPFRVDWSFLAKCLISASVMTVFIWYFNPQSLPAVLLSIPVGVTIYMVVMLLIGGFSRGEIRFIRNILRF
jgi:O-antigen/teichoic acid export membrane protein